MSQKIINATLLEKDAETDILRFEIDSIAVDVNLNSDNCQNSLKEVFSLILNKAIDSDIEVKFNVADGYSRVMYMEVCSEYIKDINRELLEVIEVLRTELSK